MPDRNTRADSPAGSAAPAPGVGSSPAEGATVLSIAVLTCDRPVLVTRLVMQLIRLVTEFCGDSGKVRVLVSDRSRDDRTRAALTALCAPVAFCTLRRPGASVATREEQLHDALEAATGRYVWCLADNDLPAEDALRHIFALIERHQPDLVLINPPVLSHGTGEVLHQNFVASRFGAPANGQDIVMTYRDMVRRVGLIHLNCLVSARIVRREAALAADWRYYADITPIHAHVMALLEAFHDAPAVFTSRHIFAWRQRPADATETEGTDRLSRRRDVSDTCVQTAGVARLLVLAVARGYLFPEDIAAIREVQCGDRAFSLTLDICRRLYEKLLAELQTRASRRPVSAEELDAIEALLMYLPPGQLGVFERAIGLARAVYPLILSAGNAGEYGYGDLSRDLALFPETEQDAIWNEVASWGIGQLKALELDLGRLQKAAA